ncbi:winged helix-turn-helix domain-containing protein [Patulibacter sp. NPDC049589]|uniref:winged helix-turn-helix domain-containing protein n=1 Tax=Patulibacter sp. NPDC049589 TaxID=3154731 RepID=UPI0034143CA3
MTDGRAPRALVLIHDPDAGERVVRQLRDLGHDVATTEGDPPGLVVAVAGPGTAAAAVTRLRRGRDDRRWPAAVVLLVLAPQALGEVPAADLRGVVDELVVRPVVPAELALRIALARGRLDGAPPADEVVRLGGLELDLALYDARLDGRPLALTHREYELLRFLVAHPGRVFSREALLEHVWGYDDFGRTRTVDVHVRRLRAKLGPDFAARIVTIRSVGYRFDG